MVCVLSLFQLSKAEDDWKRSHKAETEEAIRCAEDELKRQMEQAFDVRMKEELDKGVVLLSLLI